MELSKSDIDSFIDATLIILCFMYWRWLIKEVRK